MNMLTRGLATGMMALFAASGAMAEAADDNLVINGEIERGLEYRRGFRG